MVAGTSTPQPGPRIHTLIAAERLRVVPWVGVGGSRDEAGGSEVRREKKKEEEEEGVEGGPVYA